MTAWLTVAVAARRLGVSRQAVFKRITHHALPTRPGPTGTLVRGEDVARWEAERVSRVWHADGVVTR